MIWLIGTVYDEHEQTNIVSNLLNSKKNFCEKMGEYSLVINLQFYTLF